MSDIFAAIRNLLPADTLPPPDRYDGPYRVFTRANDLELFAREIEPVIGQLPHWSYYPSPDFDAYVQAHPTAKFKAADTAGATQSNVSVSLLLDHSGSLRGDKSCLVAMLAGFTSNYLSAIGVSYEVLGFTTSSWKGGASAQQWREAGRPSAPGRLCDVLHVVHRTFADRCPLTEVELRRMTLSGLLKENIDGEAIQWSARRLLATEAARKILIVVSDGAPVDDSTLIANGPNILDDHLSHVVVETIGAGIELYGIGVEYEMGRYFPQHAAVAEPADIRSTYLPVLSAILASSVHAPSPQGRGGTRA